MNGFTPCLLLLPLLAATAAAQTRVSYNDLHTRPVDRIPARVRVTEMLTTHGNAATDGYVYILDQLPENWEYAGKGTISVSDQYSRAGAKSIRWDWQAGDVIRIKDAGRISQVRVGVTGFDARSEAIAPFVLHIFQEKRLPTNTPLHVYFQRTTDHPTGNNEIRLTRMRYFMNFTGTPLDFSPTIRRTLAWYIPRYCFGAYNFPATVKGGQESTNGTLRFKHWARDILNGGPGHPLGGRTG